MPDPVIIDDGGSTRIRRVMSSGFGDMDGLLDVHNPAMGNPASSDPEVPAGCQYSDYVIQGSFSNVLIAWIDGAGKPGQMTYSNFTTLVKISSGLYQYVLARNQGNSLKLTIYGEKVEPIVGDSRRKKMHRYSIVNSGSIEKVEIDADPNPVYNTGDDGGPIVPATLKVPVAITSIVLT